MRTMLLSALLISAALMAPGVASAAPDKCGVFGSPGDVNQIIKDAVGTPGQNTVNLPANEFAHLRNDVRKAVCP
jgi:hypothetical protein